MQRRLTLLTALLLAPPAALPATAAPPAPAKPNVIYIMSDELGYLPYSVWKQEVLQPGDVVLGPATEADKPKGNFMYGLAVKVIQ